jgi:hypothetical protein
MKENHGKHGNFWRKIMRNHLVVSFTVYFLGVSTVIMAGVDEKPPYTLTVLAGDPSYAPNPPPVGKDIKLSYKVSLVELKDNRVERVLKKDIETVTYTLEIQGAQFYAKKLIGKVAESDVSTSITYISTTSSPVATVNAVVIAHAPGDKTARLTVTVTLKAKDTNGDNIVLEAFAEIPTPFTVLDTWFAVHVRKATNDKPSGFVFLVDGAGHNGFLDVGHAAWKVGVPDRLESDVSGVQWAKANEQWGLGANGDLNGEIDKFARLHWRLTDLTPFRVGVPGKLSSGDQGTEVHRFALKDLAAVKKALTYIVETEANPPEYDVPKHNCVDQCLAALKNSGLPAPNSKMTRTLGYSYPLSNGRWQTKTWPIQLSIPAKLVFELNKLAE